MPPKKKYRINQHKNYDLLDNVASTRPDARDEDGPFLKDVPTQADVPFFTTANIWFTHEFKFKRQGNQKKLEGYERKCIEAYYMGWLTCYDMLVENKPQIDHDIFFDWSDDDPNKKTKLTVYIDPNDILGK
jgi:hypothetical protein